MSVYFSRIKLEYSISVPPHITPFYFGEETLNVGETASLTCTVNKGDFPITIEWFLNGKPADTVAGVSVKNLGKKVGYLNVDSLYAEHSGKYTCRATNWAGSAYFTAELSVNGSFGSNACCSCAFVFVPHPNLGTSLLS